MGKALKFAKQYIKGKQLAKNSGLSEVAVAAFSGAGVYELVGNFLLYKFKKYEKKPCSMLW